MLPTVGMISSFMRKSAGSTPTTSNWFFASPAPGPTLLMVTTVPMTFGSALKTRVQKAWLRMTTGGGPGLSSSGRSRRP